MVCVSRAIRSEQTRTYAGGDELGALKCGLNPSIQEECSVRIFRQSIASLTFVAALAGASTMPSFARPAQALTVTNYYTITDGAYTAYTTDPAVPPTHVRTFRLPSP